MCERNWPLGVNYCCQYQPIFLHLARQRCASRAVTVLASIVGLLFFLARGDIRSVKRNRAVQGDLVISGVEVGLRRS